MNFESLWMKIGEFGRYQKFLYLLLCLPGLYGSMQIIQTLIFQFAIPKHRCSIPGLDNDTYQIQSEAHKNLVNQTIPLVSGFYNEDQYSSCELYSTGNTTDKIPCQRWVYDDSQFTSTIGSTMNMVCDRKFFLSIGKMMVMLGQLISSLYVGALSDTFGRRPVIIANCFFMVLASIVLAWVDSIPLALFLLSCMFQSTNGQYLTCFVFGMEIVAPSKRMWTGVVMNLFWSGGNMATALAAFLWRDWRTRQLIVSVPGILFAYLYFLPESPRWLLKHGKTDEAKKVLRKIAKGNKVDLDPDDLSYISLLETPERNEPFWKLFKSRILIQRMFITCFNWFAISMSFYGLSMNVTNLSGDIYLNFLLFVLLEVLAYILCFFLMDRLGRKRLLSFFLLGTGLTCILPLVPVLVSDKPNKWAINVLAIIGNTCASVNFAVVYTYTSELTPTTTRSSCMSLGSLSARIGSLVAPYIVDVTHHITGRFGQILPMLIFGGIAALAGFLVLLLPETLNKRLPETIEDAEKLGTKFYDDKPIRDEKISCM